MSENFELGPFEFNWIEPGDFVVGPVDSDASGTVFHTGFSTGYWLSKTVVTNGQYAELSERVEISLNEVNCPVTQVSWFDAVKFCEVVSQKYESEFKDGFSVGLPTSLQWEYACRASGDKRFGSFDDPELLLASGWFSENSEKRSQPVCLKDPNEWGLCDMLGNVAEWCSDAPVDNYPKTAIRDWKGEVKEVGKVIRGGHFAKSIHSPDIHCSSFQYLAEDVKLKFVGFRLCIRKT